MWKINIEDVESAMSLLDRFNKLNLKQVELYRNGFKIEYPESVVEEFRLTGLSNKCFVEMEFWNGPEIHSAHCPE